MAVVAEQVSVLFNGFVAQVFISMLPAVLVMACLPVVGELLNISISELGTLFLLARIGTIIGAQLGPIILRRVTVSFASVICELINFALGISLYLAIYKSYAILIFVILPLKGCCAGFLSNTRVHWLKSLFPGETGQRILVVANTVIQTSYGINGILILAGLNGSRVAVVIVFDALSSLAGAAIFYRLSKFRTCTTVPASNLSKNFELIFHGRRKWIFVSDLFLAAAMGGTNIFLVKAGESIFKTVGGYAAALVFYAVGYFSGGWLTQAKIAKNSKILTAVTNAGPFLTAVALVLLFFQASLGIVSSSMSFILFFLLFLGYPIFLLRLDSLWFAEVTPENSAKTFALRTFLVGVVWAIGEAVYASLSSSVGLGLRLVFMALAFGASCLLLKSRRLHS